jgi:hypothetical protein
MFPLASNVNVCDGWFTRLCCLSENLRVPILLPLYREAPTALLAFSSDEPEEISISTTVQKCRNELK